MIASHWTAVDNKKEAWAVGAGTGCSTKRMSVLKWWLFHHDIDFDDWSRACLWNVELKPSCDAPENLRNTL